MNIRTGVVFAVMAQLALCGAVQGQALNPPGSIDLSQPIIDEITGKPMLDDSKRAPEWVVVKAFDDHKVGERVTDLDAIRQIALSANAGSIVTADPTCARCPPLTLGWMLSEALSTRICPASNPMSRGEPKPPQCTGEEEKAEADTLVFGGRLKKALEIRGHLDQPPLPSVVLGAKSIALLKDLIAVRFKNNPTIVHQVWSMIDPNGTPPIPDFGKD